jgi:hypothetical protein
VELSLEYAGPLNTGSSHAVELKHAIREYFHPQIRGFCESQPALLPFKALCGVLPEAAVKGNRIDYPQEWGGHVFTARGHASVRIRGVECVPLITRRME